MGHISSKIVKSAFAQCSHGDSYSEPSIITNIQFEWSKKSLMADGD